MAHIPLQTVPAGDFHRALLWIRSIEVQLGRSLTLTLSELEEELLDGRAGPFARYRSPFKA